jgi:BirA family transcriptional regulator, biotin operon repressor / biotin---[acetyl-CoA-carboxylase] ligase
MSTPTPAGAPPLGTPRLHLRSTDSTNARARALAIAGAPHGTLVTAAEQTAGRGRQGRTWSAPPGRALLASLVLREVPALLAPASALAVADVAGRDATIKWPNDVLLGGRKVAGILAEGRAHEGWVVLGIGLNVAVRPRDLAPDVAAHAAGLGLEPADVEPVLVALLAALTARFAQQPDAILAAYRERDALVGHEVRWQHGSGVAAGVDGAGRLLVDRTDGDRIALEAGEVHLLRAPAAGA